MKLVISPKVRTKLAEKDRPVTEPDIVQCFANKAGKLLIDQRAENSSNPITRWFIAETNFGRKLKICFIPYSTGEIVIRTAYDPNDEEIRIYNKYGGVS